MEINLILPVSSCRANLAAIQTTLEEVVPQEPNALMNRLNELASILGTSAQVLSSYQFHLDTLRFTAVQEAKQQGYSGNMAKEFIEGRCAEIRAEYRLAERQNAALVHVIESVRSILSFTKSEIFHSNIQR